MFPGEISGGQKDIDFSRTLADLAIENKRKEYVSDIKQLEMKVLPSQFRIDYARSVIAVPLFFEGDTAGSFRDIVEAERIS